METTCSITHAQLNHQSVLCGHLFFEGEDQASTFFHAHEHERILSSLPVKKIGAMVHDMKNLLAIISGHAELLECKLSDSDPSLQHHLSTILKTVKSVDDLSRTALSVVRDEQRGKSVVDIHRLLDSIAEFVKVQFPEVVVGVEFAPEEALVQGNLTALFTAFVNIVKNSGEAMLGKGDLLIETTVARIDDFPYEFGCNCADAKRGVLITIEDTGCGIDTETSENVFSPHFTSKREGRGNGFGLYNVLTTIKEHGGHISFTSKKGEGTLFNIFFPMM